MTPIKPISIPTKNRSHILQLARVRIVHHLKQGLVGETPQGGGIALKIEAWYGEKKHPRIRESLRVTADKVARKASIARGWREWIHNTEKVQKSLARPGGKARRANLLKLKREEGGTHKANNHGN